MAMSFVRIQEFYESPNPRFRGKYFKLEDYMDWYVKESGSDSFMYPSEWAGFNVPGDAWWRFGEAFAGHADFRLKEVALKLPFSCHDAAKIKAMYFIGICEKGGRKSDIRHELAHALWYLRKWFGGYGAIARALVSRLPVPLRMGLRKSLLSQGYCKAVLDDEINAYLSVGNTVPGYGRVPSAVAKPFQALLKVELKGHGL
jgi:hypothetical protein